MSAVQPPSSSNPGSAGRQQGPTAITSMARLASNENSVPRIDSAIDLAWEPKDIAVNNIDPTRWNKIYPYQLMVVKYVNGKYTSDLNGEHWTFTLPFAPESMTITTPFASEVKATLEGIVEEHGGAPFRVINISGTTGVLPMRPAASTGRPNFLNPNLLTLAGGTVLSGVAVTETATRLTPRPNLITAEEMGGDTPGSVLRSSGYYQLRLLQRFLERYSRIKMTAEGRDMRLVFATWKDEAVYLITPQTFDVSRSASSSLRYNYRFQARAWRRINLDVAAREIHPIEINTGGLQGLNAVGAILETARDTIAKQQVSIAAARGDFQNALFGPVREIVLMAKSLSGAVVTLIDLTSNIIKDSQGSIVANIGSLRDSAQSVDQAAKGFVGNYIQASADLVAATDAAIFQPSSATNKLGLKEAANTQQALTSGEKTTLESTRNDARSPLAIQKIFDNPLSAYSVFGAIEARRVNFTPDVGRKVADEIRRVQSFTRSDLLERQASIREFMEDFADSIGQGSTTFDSTLSRISRPQVREATEADFEALWAMNSAVMAIDKLLLQRESRSSTNRAVEYVAGLARGSGIAFQNPVSKFAVPFPYGGSLERLALQYLGGANRWHEIAALNGLRAPYVDETGFELPLLVNGNGNTLAVSDVSNLHVGQSVKIGSRLVPRTTRRITSIEKVTTSFHYVIVDGDADMSLYTTTAGATLHAYLPDTVNSNQQLFIPSPKSVNPDLINRDVPGVPSFQTLLDAGGVDLALSSNNDIIVTEEGDTPWAVGLSNILQRLRILVSTPRGSLLQHPDVGIQIPVGSSTADLDAQGLLAATRDVLAQDSDFSRVDFAAVQKYGPIARQIIHVGVNGVEQLLPVSFDVVR
jgi:hypothetical protein